MFKASSLTFAVFALCGVPHVVLVLLGEYGSVQLKEVNMLQSNSTERRTFVCCVLILWTT